jgi:diacylglycerol kinase family enzyme
VHRATLIVNASAGRRKNLQTLVPALMQLLEQRGISVNAAETTAKGTAHKLAAEAAEAGCDAVFACGGDGTIHEVLQGIAGTTVALGVVPLGTANALARNLGLSLDPVEALRQQLDFAPRAIPVGEVRYATRDGEATRYFIVMAGAGPDGALVYSQLGASKSRFGRSAYYANAARLFLSRSFPPFRVEYRSSDADEWLELAGVSAMCARVADLGGILSRLTRGNSLLETGLRLIVVKPPAFIGLPAWFAFSGVRLHGRNLWLKTVRVSEFRCTPLAPAHRTHVQVDGEWVGYLPMSVRLSPGTISLLMPKPEL